MSNRKGQGHGARGICSRTKRDLGEVMIRLGDGKRGTAYPKTKIERSRSCGRCSARR